MKNTWSITAIVSVMIFAVFTIVFCSPVHRIMELFAEDPPIVPSETKELGDGAISFSLYVTKEDGTIVEYLIHTDRKTIGSALKSAGLAVFEDSDIRGNQPVVFDGMETDVKKGTYWAIYINLKYVNVQLDDVIIFTDTIYELRFDTFL